MCFSQEKNIALSRPSSTKHFSPPAVPATISAISGDNPFLLMATYAFPLHRSTDTLP